MPQYSDDELLDHLVDCYNEHGKVTTQILNDDDRYPSGPTYGNRFESLAAALGEAGLSDEAATARNRQRNVYSKKDILLFVEDVSESGELTRRMIETADGPTVQTVLNNLDISSFDAIDSVVHAVTCVKERNRTIASKDLVDNGLLKADQENESITEKLLNENSEYPNVNEVDHYYGDLPTACRELGID